MKIRFFIGTCLLVATALACSAPGAAQTVTPLVQTVVVTAPPLTSTAETPVSQPAGISCAVQRDVRIHFCAGATSNSVVGTSPAGSGFTATKWNGSGWFYGEVPTASGLTWGWVSQRAADGSTLVSCSGDLSSLPSASEPCPAVPPTSTHTPLPPTDTPQPTVTSTLAPTLTPTVAAVCGNGVKETGEQCDSSSSGCGTFETCTQTCTCRRLIGSLPTIAP